MKAVFQVFSALVLTLDSEAASGSSEAKGLLKQVKNVGFLFRTVFLIDVLECFK